MGYLVNPAETGWYYLKSRYYDPEVGRFINADVVDVLAVEQNSLIQYNLYAYCLNNPITHRDVNGYLAAAVIGGSTKKLVDHIEEDGHKFFINVRVRE